MGVNPKNIMSFLKKANPKYEQYFSQALLAGYTSEQAFDFITKSMGGGKVSPKVEKQVYGGANESNLVRQARFKDPDRKDNISPLIGGAVGAVAGGLTGGPIGAAVGGVTGYKELKKLSKAYENHVQQGGKLPFGEFIQSIAKAGTVAGVAGSQIEPLKQAAMAYMASDGDPEGGGPEAGGPESSDTGQSPPVVGSEEITEETITESPTPETPPDLKASYDLFSNRNQGKVIDALAEKITPEEGYTALKGLYGSDFLKDLERIHKKPAQEIVKEAFEYSQQKNGAVEEKESVDEIIEKPKVESVVGETVEKKKPKETEKKSDQRYSDDPKTAHYTDIFKERIPSIGGSKSKKTPNTKDLSGALKSSNVHGAFFDEDTNKMRMIFAPKKGGKPGTVYTYDNVGKQTFENILGGKAQPITEGSNIFGSWFHDKKNSKGAAFDAFIKKNADKYPYEKLEKESHTIEEKQILEAGRSFIAADLFEPIKELRKKGRQLNTASELKDIMPTLRDVDDDFVSQMIGYIEDKIKLKHPPTKKRLQKEITKEFL